jgi:AcrR family transcriptional regulator
MDQALSRRERKKLETHQALLEAALVLFREKGYNATTVEEITERADVAKGTFFNYFSSKETLLGELAVWRVEQLRAALDVRQGAPESPMARIKLFVRLMHGQFAEEVKLYRRAFASRLVSPPPPSHRAKHELFGFFTDLVAEAQSWGEIRSDIDAAMVSDMLRMVFFRRFVHCHDGGGEAPPVEEFERIIDLMMDGLAGPNWSGA